MLKKFTRDVLISGIVLRKLKRDRQHIQAIHTHPAGAVGLLEVSAGWQGSGSVKHSDIVKTQKAALENIGAVRIFPIHPPCEIQEQLVKDFFEEPAIGDASNAPFDFINAPRSPGMYRRIDIAKCPLICGKLSVRMHVPFAQQQNELFLCEIGVDDRERNTVERQVPRRVPRILPLVRHRNDVVVVEMRPILVPSV